jgi:hypothetical protein
MKRSYQYVFRWFEDGLRSQVGVMALCPFRPEVIKDRGYSGSVVVGGQEKHPAYSSWLKWSSPLSPSFWGN